MTNTTAAAGTQRHWPVRAPSLRPPPTLRVVVVRRGLASVGLCVASRAVVGWVGDAWGSYLGGGEGGGGDGHGGHGSHNLLLLHGAHRLHGADGLHGRLRTSFLRFLTQCLSPQCQGDPFGPRHPFRARDQTARPARGSRSKTVVRERRSMGMRRGCHAASRYVDAARAGNYPSTRITQNRGPRLPAVLGMDRIACLGRGGARTPDPVGLLAAPPVPAPTTQGCCHAPSWQPRRWCGGRCARAARGAAARCRRR